MPAFISDSPWVRTLISIGDQAIATEDNANLPAYRETTSFTVRVPTWASMDCMPEDQEQNANGWSATGPRPARAERATRATCV